MLECSWGQFLNLFSLICLKNHLYTDDSQVHISSQYISSKKQTENIKHVHSEVNMLLKICVPDGTYFSAVKWQFPLFQLVKSLGVTLVFSNISFHQQIIPFLPAE